VLVVSWKAINEGLRSPIVARITSRARERALPTYVPLEAGEAGLPEPSYVLCHDLVTLRESDFRRRSGLLPLGRMLEVERALRQALALESTPQR
jgi:mRNA-degrading endonuclease toxin of MazEF toxin-antitoxin module